MKKKRYTDEQIGFVLRQAEAGTTSGSTGMPGNCGAWSACVPSEKDAVNHELDA